MFLLDGFHLKFIVFVQRLKLNFFKRIFLVSVDPMAGLLSHCHQVEDRADSICLDDDFLSFLSLELKKRESFCRPSSHWEKWARVSMTNMLPHFISGGGNIISIRISSSSFLAWDRDFFVPSTRTSKALMASVASILYPPPPQNEIHILLLPISFIHYFTRIWSARPKLFVFKVTIFKQITLYRYFPRPFQLWSFSFHRLWLSFLVLPLSRTRPFIFTTPFFNVSAKMGFYAFCFTLVLSTIVTEGAPFNRSRHAVDSQVS